MARVPILILTYAQVHNHNAANLPPRTSKEYNYLKTTALLPNLDRQSRLLHNLHPLYSGRKKIRPIEAKSMRQHHRIDFADGQLFNISILLPPAWLQTFLGPTGSLRNPGSVVALGVTYLQWRPAHSSERFPTSIGPPQIRPCKLIKQTICVVLDSLYRSTGGTISTPLARVSNTAQPAPIAAQ